MATVVVTFDTVKKTCDVTMDGSAMANVGDIQIFRISKDEYALGLVQREEDEANDTVVYHRTIASDRNPHAALLNEMRDVLMANRK